MRVSVKHAIADSNIAYRRNVPGVHDVDTGTAARRPPSGSLIRSRRAAGRVLGGLLKLLGTSCATRELKYVIGLFALVSVAACGGGHSSSGSAPNAASYAISGSVSHLSAPGLVLSNGNETLAVNEGAAGFSFTPPVANGVSYNVTVATQPAGENCVVSNGAGTVSGADVSTIAVACNTVISQPTPVGVYPVGSTASSDSRVFLPITMVGNNNVGINAILDTGSAGVVLNAFDIFPSSMVTSNGFVFPPGQTSITYNGITVTNVSATKSFGGQSPNPTKDIGNLGFAQMSVGTQGNVTTAVIPILFVYQFEKDNVVTTPGAFSNLVGINPEISALAVAGSPQAAGSTLSVCTPQSTTTCAEVSPFRSISFAQGVDEGYILNQFTLNNCTIDTPGDCPAGNFLNLGLNSSVSQSFGSTPLTSCVPISVSGMAGQQACSQVIPNVTIASGNSSFTGSAIFDSGEPTVRIEVPEGSVFPASLPQGTSISLTTPSGFLYTFQTGTGFASTEIVQGASATNFTNTGIAFFTQHSLLVDYTSQTEGWH